MAFKTAVEYNEERYGGLFLLKDDGDFCDVIFLYQSKNDALVADAHYVRSSDYNGYVHCLEGNNRPECERNLRVQTKLFIPLYKIETDEVLFWDRGVRFYNQLEHDVFANYADPSQYVFRITRHGQANNIETYYTIEAIAKNVEKPFDKIVAEHKISFPTYYENIIKTWTAEDYKLNMTSQNTSETSGESYSTSSDTLPEYKLSPRNISPVVPIEVEQADVLDESGVNF